jgi:hypothetical protein
MSQHGQLIRLKRTGRDREPTWAYRYRVGGRDSKRVQVAGLLRNGTPWRPWSGTWNGYDGSSESQDP